MLGFYWMCLIVGVIFALVTFLFTDVIGSLLDGLFDAISTDVHVLDPVVIVGGVTTLGGAGITLTEYTDLPALVVLLLSLLIAVFLSMLVLFFYVKPMKNTENSTGFSMQDLVGKIGEVIVPVPAKGYGEVLIKIGAGHTNQIAASFDREEIQSGTRVVVIEAKDDTLYVSRFENR